VHPTAPDRLILDGQQRLTSLFQAISLGRPVETQDVRKKSVTGWFYVDMQRALKPQTDREETIRFVPADRVVRTFRGDVSEDYSTPEREYEAMMFPVSRIFDWPTWQMGFLQHWQLDPEKFQLLNRFYGEVVQRFEHYQVPVIELGRQTPREAVCAVFEKVTGGVTLTVFELLTATFAADEYDLRQDWEKRKASWATAEHRVLDEVSNTDFLQVVSLLATQARRSAFVTRYGTDDERAPRIGCKRGDMLALTLDEYKLWAPDVVADLKLAARFLHGQYVYDTKFLPYGTQLIPLAAILATLGRDAEPQGAQERIARWFWCGVFGELYGGTTETRFTRDLPEVVAWVRAEGGEGGGEPRTVTEAQFAPSRLLTLRTRGSAAYKGLYALLLREGAVDWRTGSAATVMNYLDEAVDIHHIFPKAWCAKAGIDEKLLDSIVNKTPLSARTNRVIGGLAPSAYLSRLANSAGVHAEAIDKNVETHLVGARLLRSDDFHAFFDARRTVLLERIGAATGKPVDLRTTGALAGEGTLV
jgi:hypothetical protein